MRFFDANVQVGRFRQLTEGIPFERDELLADMDRFGIAEALVMDSLSREVHPRSGNRRVLDITRDHPRLHPSWSLVPHLGGEIGPLDTLLDRMYEVGVRAVKLFPRHYTFNLSDWCMGPVLAVLEEGRIPTFIDYNASFVAGWPPDDTDWEAVVALCQAHPRLPVIISEGRFRQANRIIYQALQACPNLHLELSGFWVHHGIEYVCRNFGARRLLFGTRWPIRELGGTIAQVRLADVSDADKAAIAGDNLRELLAGAFPRRRRVPAPRVIVKAPVGNTLRARLLRNEPPTGEVIIDCHAHLGQAAIYHLADSTPAQVASEMTRLGVRCSIVFGFSGVIGDWTRDNDHVAAAMQRHPDRFLGLILVNCNHRGEMLRELERCQDRGFIGVKLIPQYQGYPEEGPNVEAAVAWAAQRGMIVLNHGWGSPDHLRRLAETYPQVTFIIGHYALEYARVVNSYPNVYQCTCEPLGYRSMEVLTAAVRPDKILFGSDITDLPLPLGMGPILMARIPEEDKRRILGLNALALLERLGRRV